MKSTKKLLSISNLKKYFPVAKSSIFQKEQLYVRANEDISIDIYEGETVGVVGESGCGKSTLGRVLLQLYPQTAGTTMYYGSTLDATTPKYVIDTLRRLDHYKAKLAKASEKAAELSKKVVDAGGEENADFYLLQDRNLALCDEQTCLMHIVTILGGFFAKDEGGKGRELMERVYHENVKRNKLVDKRAEISVEYELCAGKGESQKAAGLKAKLDELDGQIAVYDQSTAACQRELDDLRARNAGDPEFAKYEAMRDGGIDLARLEYSEMRLLRKDLQIIFQDPYSSLNPRMTIGQIIEEGLLTHNFYRKGSKQMEEHILSTMGECGLQDYMVNRYPHQFSGGQRQRIGIARALALKPKLIVCDEPVSALDVSIQSQILNLLKDLQQEFDLTYLFISHDLGVVHYISDRICVMFLGKVCEIGETGEIYKKPMHPYTRFLLQAVPSMDPEKAQKREQILAGEIPSAVNPPSGCRFRTRCPYAKEICGEKEPELKEYGKRKVACHFPLEG